MCKKISAIDSVYNCTMALECEFKGLSRMPSMKRSAAVFARAAVTISKPGGCEGPTLVCLSCER